LTLADSIWGATQNFKSIPQASKLLAVEKRMLSSPFVAKRQTGWLQTFS
jgi:hypothetical protein